MVREISAREIKTLCNDMEVFLAQKLFLHSETIFNDGGGLVHTQ